MFLAFLCVNTAIHMNDMFNQQQAKTHKEVVEKKSGDRLQGTAEKIE